MPSYKNKAAAVPFINQKGERSMKKVKVEIYVAGKKPSYAPDDDDLEPDTSEDEDVEYEDEVDGGVDEDEQQRQDVDREEAADLDVEPDIDGRRGELKERLVEEPSHEQAKKEHPEHNDDDDDDDDDPRFRKLRQLSKFKMSADQLIRAQTSSRKAYNFNDNNAIIEEENEEEVKVRHLTARKLKIGEPLGAQAVLSELGPQADVKHAYSEDDDNDDRFTGDDEKELETEDILADYTVKLIRKKDLDKQRKIAAEERAKRTLRDGLREAEIKADTMRRIEEENKREFEKEALDKGDFELLEIGAVITEDEDDELAYEEWKLREIKRVKRDRLERAAKA